MIAAGKGNVRMVQLLLDKGAEIDQQSSNGTETALIIATRSSFRDAMVVSSLIKAGADINKANKYGVTPLKYAIFEGSVDCGRIIEPNGVGPIPLL